MSEKIDKQIEELRKSEEDARRRHFAFIEPLGGWHESRPKIEAVNDRIHGIRNEIFGNSSIIPEINEPQTPLRDGTVNQ